MTMQRSCAVLAAQVVVSAVTVMTLATYGTATAVASVRGNGHVWQRSHGFVKGTLVRVDGPIGPGDQQPKEVPIPGLIRFAAVNRHLVVKVRVGHKGRFQVRLPSGRYHIVGHSPGLEIGLPGDPEAWCSQPLSVVVHPGRTAKIIVACPAL